MPLTEEDKSWLKAEVTDAIKASEDRLTVVIAESIASSGQRTAQAIAASEQRTAHAIAASEQRTAGAIAATEDRLKHLISEAIAASEQRTAQAIADAIATSEQRTAGAIAATEDRLKHLISEAIAASEQRTAEAIERTETKLLTAFHQWASPVDARVRSLGLALRALDQEGESDLDRDRKIADLELRVRKLERAS
jgi:hypothetical protein